MPTQLLTDHAPLELRARGALAAKWFNASKTWLPLARALAEIRVAKTWHAWGFRSFRAYVEEDLDLRKNVSSELVLACKYLTFHHPECAREDGSAAEHIPSYANIVILARQVGRLQEDVVEQLDQRLFAGSIKRKTLKEEIEKELTCIAEAKMPIEVHAGSADYHPEQAGQNGRSDLLDFQELISSLDDFYKAIDLEALWEAIRQVFDGREEASIDERRQLIGRLRELLDRLEALKGELEHPLPQTPAWQAAATHASPKLPSQ
jgi:hypothetical protein